MFRPSDLPAEDTSTLQEQRRRRKMYIERGLGCGDAMFELAPGPSVAIQAPTFV
jgi:hypothetical protein